MSDNTVFSFNHSDKPIFVHSAGYPDSSIPRFHSKDSEFIFEYVLSGELTVESPDILIHAGIGDMIIIHPKEECVLYRSCGDLKTIGFSVSGFILEAAWDVLGLPSYFSASLDAFDKLVGVDNLYKKYGSGDGNCGREFCELAFSLILDAYSCIKTTDPHARPTAESIKDYLDLCLCGDVDLDTVGKKFGITGMHVIRLFRGKYEETPMQYLKLSRLEKSAELLVSTDMTIKEISSLLRFSSTQHFTNLFREHFGTSPGKYRESNN